jgi:hypothetical protein
LWELADNRTIITDSEPVPDFGFSHRECIRNHIDNLWLLGGELIRSLSHDKSLRNVPAEKLVADSVDEEGGPLCYHLDTEQEQAVFDSTCRKLHKFLKSKT